MNPPATIASITLDLRKRSYEIIPELRIKRQIFLEELETQKEKVQKTYGDVKGDAAKGSLILRSQQKTIDAEQKKFDQLKAQLSEWETKHLEPQLKHLENPTNHPLFRQWLTKQSNLVYRDSMFAYIMAKLKVVDDPQDIARLIKLVIEEMQLMQKRHQPKSIRFKLFYQKDGKMESFLITHQIKEILEMHRKFIAAILMVFPDEVYTRTIYPLQDSIAFTIAAPPSDFVIQQLWKLPQEELHPDWFALVFYEDPTRLWILRKGGSLSHYQKPTDPNGPIPNLDDIKNFVGIQNDVVLVCRGDADFKLEINGLGQTTSAFIRYPIVAENQSVNLVGLVNPLKYGTVATIRDVVLQSGLAKSLLQPLRDGTKKRSSDPQISIFWAQVPLLGATVWSKTLQYAPNSIAEYQGKYYTKEEKAIPNQNQNPNPMGAEWVPLKQAIPVELMPILLCLYQDECKITIVSSFHLHTVYPCLEVLLRPNHPDVEVAPSTNTPIDLCRAAFQSNWSSVMGGVRIQSKESTNRHLHVEYVNAGGRCQRLILTPNISIGAVLVNLAKLFAEILDVDYASLQDSSTKTCPGSSKWSFSLGLLTFMKEKRSWYQKFGFVPCVNAQEIQFLEWFTALPWAELAVVAAKLPGVVMKPLMTERIENLNFLQKCLALQNPTVGQMISKGMESICITTTSFLDEVFRLGSSLRNVTGYHLFRYANKLGVKSYWIRRLTAQMIAELKQPSQEQKGTQTVKSLF
jgi:hypothetical protein